ncbi:branched-chain amino acid transport system permease protein [Clostridium tetanomorphum]|uniref:Branched-chain amino acid ABC transporter permease n=1 Tax=Clostridium tetanomorphum TaxID=1553 RepID=A0A923EEE5_CLOTT|nr:branched-chain amino acid ABC transporter permease [Clostridium tetanomorphum]KAJ50744.1 amino acid ABC transporter permease [Clostridium tetanomorphum DSM 665]MBC2399959.1 branched-chain amino acid ABC transporter permease [Clostridium tetanomorphum]MBP1865841.1 branched-chain amino acid transport system permease protein [Clostridium tetanomorphum]NRS85290.1 branched-chain amino acid transport system permease protein [Clostridium tetanomorphum]NRZ98467.1 branched-chain amino acid transport
MKWLNKKNIACFIAIIAVYVLSQWLISGGYIDSYILLNIVLIGINIILAVSLNLITGFTGQFSLGHAAFMAVGAYVSAIMTSKLNYPFAVAVLLAAIAAAFVGLIIGIPTLRLKGDYLAIATLGFGEIIRILLLNIEYVGGASGFNDIPQYTTWTWIYFGVIGTVILIKNFINSYAGRACIAIREDEIAAEAMGINTTLYKVLSFVIGAFFAGIAGALYANYFYFIKPSNFGFMRSIDILVIVVFGGMGSIAGSIVGAIALSIISLFLQNIPELRMVIYAVILFLIMVYRPEGLLGKAEGKRNLFKRGGRINGSINN